MYRSYPEEYVPASMYEMGDQSRELLRRLEALTGSDFDIADYTEQVESYIVEVVGDPAEILLEQLSIWYVRYRDLWTPVLAWYFSKGNSQESVTIWESYILMARMLVRDGFRSRLGLEEAQRLAGNPSEDIESPWIPMFIEWHNVGRKQYVVSSGLAQRLGATVLKGYPCDQLKLPYDSFWVDLRNWDEFGDRGKLEGCLVHYLWDEENNNDKFQIAVASPPGSSHRFPRILRIDLSLGTLEEALEDGLSMHEAYAEYRDEWEAMFRYIVNVILYATMPDAEAEFDYWDPQYKKLKKRLSKLSKGSSKRSKVSSQLKSRSSAGYTRLGGSISIDRSFDRDASGGSGGGSGRTLSVRSLVSGHWRDQACGAGRRDRKRIWIEPFWRGPEYAPVTQKSHKLK